MGQRLQAFKVWLDSGGDWHEAGRTIERWILPAFFYSFGIALIARTLVSHQAIDFSFRSASRVIREWLIFLNDGQSVDLGNLLETTTSFSFSLPMTLLYSVVALWIAYKLTPK